MKINLIWFFFLNQVSSAGIPLGRCPPAGRDGQLLACQAVASTYHHCQSGGALLHYNPQVLLLTSFQVSVDHAGEFYASCSDDGRVVVTGLYSDDHTLNFSMDQPVASIAIDPI